MVKRGPLFGAIALLFAGQGAMNRTYLFDFWKKNYAGKDIGASAGLSPDQLLFAAAGFREMIAGILWVRADSFFDTGNYDAILPIIKLVTILDPKQIDVYATGMWHIGYNFTDEEQRSDRRYIPSALALGMEGADNNKETYELFFETGWMWFHKVKDNPWEAVKWFEEANKRKDMLPARRNLLALAYQKNGEVIKGLDHWYMLLDEARKTMADKELAKDATFSARTNTETVENNLDTLLVRMVQRGFVAKQDGRYDQGDYDTKPPFNVGFSAKVTVVEPRVLRIEGTWNVLPVGTRVRAILRDADFPTAKFAEMQWDQGREIKLDPPRNLTWMQDELFVRNRRFNKKVDMSKDPTMYPFASKTKKYILEFFYTPRDAPAHIQDKFGWNGEGFTDANFLRNDVRPGVGVMYTTLELSQDMILRRGDWSDKTPVLRTKNYVETEIKKKDDDVLLDIPALRSGV